ncbi:MAG: hypothetical protein ACLVJ6_15745 [Merdibacter sp.]
MEEQMFEAVMMGLRLREGIDLERFAGRYHKRLEDHFSTALQKHLGNDLVIEDGFLKTSEQEVSSARHPGRFSLKTVAFPSAYGIIILLFHWGLAFLGRSLGEKGHGYRRKYRCC